MFEYFFDARLHAYHQATAGVCGVLIWRDGVFAIRYDLCYPTAFRVHVRLRPASAFAVLSHARPSFVAPSHANDACVHILLHEHLELLSTCAPGTTQKVRRCRPLRARRLTTPLAPPPLAPPLAPPPLATPPAMPPPTPRTPPRYCSGRLLLPNQIK